MDVVYAGEQLKKAIKWVSDARSQDLEANLFKLIDEACLEFDLSPYDEEFLVHFFTEKGSEKSLS